MLKIKTFSATKNKNRDALGETITSWIAQTGAICTRKEVVQSSDSEYHCFSIVIFYTLPSDPDPESKP
jgi:hypothetical protein